MSGPTKKQLADIYDKKFEDYKEDISARFSDYVDIILEEEIKIPEIVLQYTKKGELYDDLMKQMQVRLGIDNGCIEKDIKECLKQAKDEILDLRADLNTAIGEYLEVEKDCQDMAAQLYIHEKCKGLTDTQKNQVFMILEGETDKAEIDRKFDIITKSKIFPENAVMVENRELHKIIQGMLGKQK